MSKPELFVNNEETAGSGSLFLCIIVIIQHPGKKIKIMSGEQ